LLVCFFFVVFFFCKTFRFRFVFIISVPSRFIFSSRLFALTFFTYTRSVNNPGAYSPTLTITDRHPPNFDYTIARYSSRTIIARHPSNASRARLNPTEYTMVSPFKYITARHPANASHARPSPTESTTVSLFRYITARHPSNASTARARHTPTASTTASSCANPRPSSARHISHKKSTPHLYSTKFFAPSAPTSSSE
jgi:hypothetical protein